MCQNNEYEKCLKHLAIGHELDGGFAEYIVLPKPFIEKGPIIKVDQNIPLSLAALAEPVGCCLRGIKQNYFSNKLKNISIIGGGPIGAIITTILSIKFPEIRITIIEPSEKRRKLLISEKIGNNWCDKTENIKNNEGGELIFVACSVLEAQSEAIRIVDQAGTICLFGGINKSKNLPILDSNLIHYKELCVYGTTGSNKENVKEALEIISKNVEKFKKLLSEKYLLSDINNAFKSARAGNKLKIFVTCGQLDDD
jgi:L-iditol 2-dehydrogenase